jgi:hypothetical protein
MKPQIEMMDMHLVKSTNHPPNHGKHRDKNNTSAHDSDTEHAKTERADSCASA